ncbi:helicase-related protein [Luteipulveratus sp. YIM 133132]|uniref:helicase-related protein n=1 Tax=Luteipulveratus flavus TaxID=3031728 RepID=UPI0023AFCBA5|nr:helicase-related protein [Luteipulveratus sp. YIM 133132]MDE9363981.1 helicase-related protein [Luteipulveratus sp. YIM 133132]
MGAEPTGAAQPEPVAPTGDAAGSSATGSAITLALLEEVIGQEEVRIAPPRPYVDLNHFGLRPNGPMDPGAYDRLLRVQASLVEVGVLARFESEYKLTVEPGVTHRLSTAEREQLFASNPARPEQHRIGQTFATNYVQAPDERTGQWWAPRGDRGRALANLAALQTLQELREADRPATEGEKGVLSRWTAWGALPKVFDEHDTTTAVADVRAQLRDLVSEPEWAAARRTTINAHYTDPAYVSSIWAALTTHLGFTGGQVLEPGCGSGTFIAAAPTDARVTGVELDPVTADIAGYLYPAATIRTESFAVSPFADGTFDLTVGNVPFANVNLHDRQHNAGNHSMHNHFIIKSLALTRPGGLVAVLTSRYTLDAVNDAARQEMYDVADLAFAVRLPSGAHRRLAGTEAVTDLLVLRKRLPDETPGDNTWLHAPLSALPRERGDGVEQVPLNAVWATDRAVVLGDQQVGHGMHGSATVQVRADLDPAVTAAAFHDAVNQLAAATPLRLSPAPQGYQQPDPLAVVEPVARASDITRFAGHLSFDGTDWTRLVDGLQEPVEVPAAQQRELAALLQLRDDVVAVLTAEASTTEDTADLAQARAALNRHYDAYLERYGPINRVKVTPIRRLDKAGDPIVRRAYPPAIKTFRTDPHSPVTKALEHYDESTNTASKAAVFRQRVVTPHIQRTSAESPADALAIVMDTAGEVRLPEVARLLGAPEPEAREALGTLVFDDPATAGRLVPAAEYLSGNVREALRVAQQAATERPELQVNVDALRRVIPADLEPAEIAARLGSVWIPDTDVQQFLRETLRDPGLSVVHLGGSNWHVRDGHRHSQAATSTWGTDRINAHTIAERLMQQKRVVVYDTVENANGNDMRVVNLVATEAAQEKATNLQDRFGQWVWADPERAQRLAAAYNEAFNSLVLRSYDEDGQRLTLPGLAAWFTPHPHQRAAVARIIADPSVGLYHEVGAGKTAEMVIGATELRRLGLVNKPAAIVPGHMLEQFSREWLQLYPQANILAAGSEDLRGDGRRQFIARAATGDWDAIILTYRAFQSIAVSPTTEAAYVDQEIQTLRAQLGRAQELGDSRSVKDMERAVLRAERKLEQRLDHDVDPGLTWEQTGIDYLIVDELHSFKNLTIASNIPDAAKDGSHRATDLDMKISALRARAGVHGKVMTGATATPIANSMSEAYVMQKYLRPDLLVEAGITDFDAWAATFGQTVSRPEMKPAGDGFQMKDRFARFQNIPEMLRMWHLSADVKTAKDLTYLKRPPIAPNSEGQRLPEIVPVQPTAAQRAYITGLGERARKIKAGVVPQDVDNMPKVSTDGRKAGLDIRLTDHRPTGQEALFAEPSKVDVAAARIHRLWAEHRDDAFLIDPDHPEQGTHPNRGGLQLVFCDWGTPKDDAWNMYDEMRHLLTGHGMDPSRIRFIHEANSDVKKARLFEQCRSGEVDVLIGSTQKMGVGTNVQTRALALHHIDCPWTPADVEQREGRIVRQGNQYPEVQILRYVTVGSFDGYMWQTVARKAKFRDDVMHGSLDARQAADLKDGQGEKFDYGVIEAVSSGNPLLLEKTAATEDVAKLRRLQTAHARNQSQRQNTIAANARAVNELYDLVPVIERAIGQRRPTQGSAFSAVINGRGFSNRTDATRALEGLIEPLLSQANFQTRPRVVAPVVAELGGHTFGAVVHAQPGTRPSVAFHLRDLPDHARFTVPADDIRNHDGYGLMTKLENTLARLDPLLASTRDRISLTESESAEARNGLGAPFPRAAELAAAEARLTDIEEKINAHAARPTSSAEQADPAEPESQPATDQQAVNADGMARVRDQLARNQQHPSPAHVDPPLSERVAHTLRGNPATRSPHYDSPTADQPRGPRIE